MTDNVVQPNTGDGQLITLDQIQAIQGAKGAEQLRLMAPPPDWRKFKKVHVGLSNRVRFGPTSVRSTSLQGLCGPATIIVACPKQPPADVDRDGAETIATGVSEGLRRSPLIVVDQAPWQQPGFRGVRYPQTTCVVVSTFGATDTRTVQLQAALASYLGTTNAPIATAVPVAGTPTAVISFQVPDYYKGDRVVVTCQDHEVLYLSQWIVMKNGKAETGPFYLIEGEAAINVQAKRDDWISLAIVIASGDSFAVPMEVLIEGYTWPTLQVTDGTYSRVLRSSPNWSTEEGF